MPVENPLATVDKPGVYDALDEALYHSDPVASHLGRSLSVSGAKKLLPPSTPARFAYEREHGQKASPAFDFGHAAHAHVLGVGATIVSVEADDWRTKAAKEAAAEARERGDVPLLAREYAKAQAMVDALRAHPLASAVLSGGKPEQSIFWVDDDTGVCRRGRIDWLRPNAIVDYKTTSVGGADPERFAKTAVDFGYHMQAAWYTDGAAALGLGALPFVFVVQEKEPPYLVSVVQLDEDALRIGRDLNAAALSIYAECESAGEWPGYPVEVVTVALPSWYARKH
jgi:hypothetical protein